MKHLELFESYFKDKIDNLLEDIKSEVDLYLYSITDEYQIDSSTDYTYISNNIVIVYNLIQYRSDFWDKFLNIKKTIKKVFDGDTRLDLILKDGGSIWSVNMTEISKNDPETFTLSIIISIPH